MAVSSPKIEVNKFPLLPPPLWCLVGVTTTPNTKTDPECMFAGSRQHHRRLVQVQKGRSDRRQLQRDKKADALHLLTEGKKCQMSRPSRLDYLTHGTAALSPKASYYSCHNEQHQVNSASRFVRTQRKNTKTLCPFAKSPTSVLFSYSKYTYIRVFDAKTMTFNSFMNRTTVSSTFNIKST